MTARSVPAVWRPTFGRPKHRPERVRSVHEPGRILSRWSPEKERGPALAGWPSLKCGRSRVPPSSVHSYCITTNRCCQGLRCSFLDADKLPGRLTAALRGALPPWGGRGVGLPLCRCCPVLCRRTKKALDSLAGVWYGRAVGSISLNRNNLAKFYILLNCDLAKCGCIGSDEI